MKKLITKVFVFSQILDFLTTVVGIKLFPTIVEGNPLVQMLWISMILKAIIVFYISIILEQRDFSKLAWLIPVVPIINVVWNITVIFLEKVG